MLPALAITTRFGIGLGETVLLCCLIGFARPLWRQCRLVPVSARWIVIAFAINLAAVIGALPAGGAMLHDLDNPSRQLLVMAAIGLIVLTRPQPLVFWYGLMLGAFGAGATAVFQVVVLHMERAQGFHQAIMFGDISLVTGLMALAAIGPLATQPRRLLRVLPYLAFAAGLLASLLSGSRGGWFAVLLAGIPLYAYGRRIAPRKLALAAMAVVIALAAIGLAPQMGVHQRLQDAVTDVQQYEHGSTNTSLGLRFQMWQGAWQLFREHPLLGVGRANFNPALNQLVDRGELGAGVRDFRHAHNEILHALATGGVVGGLALLLLYAAPLAFFAAAARRGDAARPYALAGLVLVMAFIHFGLTQVLFSHHVGSAFYALTVAVLAGLCLIQQPVAKGRA